MTPWVIFDGDNTLWDVEHLYDEARLQLCRSLQNQGADPGAVERFQQMRDKELYATYGYSACRFARSFEDTLLHFVPKAISSEVRDVRQLALMVFEQTARFPDELVTLLDRLVARYSLGIITAGERWVQERRLSQFQLVARFAAIDVVEAKDAHVFRSFCARNQANVGQSWVVGDSIRSDILPAISAGLKAVFLSTNNWTQVEIDGHELPSGVPVISALKDLDSILHLD